MALVMSPHAVPSIISDSDGGVSHGHPHPELEDSPRVAAIDDGGPPIDPGRLTEPVDYEYQVVQGFFVQNGPKPKHFAFNEILERNFGLVDESQARWSNLKASMKRLQASAEQGVIYKVLFLGRHGQGWHNYAVDQYGEEEWEAYWTFENTDGKLTWGPDPELTPLGHSQAAAVHQAWLREAPLGAPITPSEMKWYVSPMTRACQTMVGSFGKYLPGVEGREGVAPEIWEDWREIYGSHTCDKRSTRSEIVERFPEFIIEDGFVEADELWKTDDRESELRMQQRGRRALDRLFGDSGAKETFISITSHSQYFRNLLAVLNHQPYTLATGEMIPIVVKATPTRAHKAQST